MALSDGNSAIPDGNKLMSDGNNHDVERKRKKIAPPVVPSVEEAAITLAVFLLGNQNNNI